MTAFESCTTSPRTRLQEGVIARSLHGAEATLAAIELEPSTEAPEHSHVNEPICILTSGLLTFRIGDEQQALEPGAT